VPQWYNVDNPKFAALFRPADSVADLHLWVLQRRIGRDLNFMAISGYQPVTAVNREAAAREEE
jgi:hypothetical protein